MGGQWRLDFRNGRKELEHALHEFHRQIQTFRELTGVRGRPETIHETILWSPLTPNGNAEIRTLWAAFGDKHGWLVNKDNRAAVLAECLELTKKAAAMVPVVDKLRDPEEDDKRVKENAEREEERRIKSEQCEKAFAAVMAKKPAWAEWPIVAEYEVDKCDIQTDYFAVETKRIVAIGWRRGKKEDFKQLRQAAGNFPDTAHLKDGDAEKIEHRDNYSMGVGNYLKNGTHYCTGWAVCSYDSKRAPSLIIEDALPSDNPPPAPPDKGKGPSMAEVRNGTKEGFVEILFPEKPERSVMQGLYEAGFRFSRHGGKPHWWGKKENLPAEYNAPLDAPVPSELGEERRDPRTTVTEPNDEHAAGELQAAWKPVKEPEPEVQEQVEPAPQQSEPANRPTELHGVDKLHFRPKTWNGQCTAKNSEYLTDGRMLILRKFTDKTLAKKYAAIRPAPGTRYHAEPLKEEHAAKVLDCETAEPLTVLGWLGMEEIEKLAGERLGGDADAVLVLSYDCQGTEKKVYLDAHRYLFIIKLLGRSLESVELCLSKNPQVIIFKGESGDKRNAAVLMSFSGLEDIIEKALANMKKNGVKQTTPDLKRPALKVEEKGPEVKQTEPEVKRPELRIVPKPEPFDYDAAIRRSQALRKELGF